MAVDANAFLTFAAKGNREDLADVIYRIDPTETPFISGIERVKATGTTHEWQTQALAAAAANAQLEGDDANTNAATASVRLGNVTQISTKVPRVSGTQIAVKSAGRGDELDYQAMLKGLELKRDMEFITVGANTAKNAGNSSTARLQASILSWIKSNYDFATAGSPANPAAADGTGTRTDGTQRAFTETSLKSVLQQVWINGGNPDTVMVGAFNKQAFSTFTGRGTPTEETVKKKITAAVEIYESDFGVLKVVANRFSRSRDCLVLEMEKWALATLRNMTEIELAKTGDSARRMVLTEYTLEARNEKASGIVADLTTS